MTQTETLTDPRTASVPASAVAILLLWRQRRLLALFFAASLVLSAAIVFLIPGEYRSTVEIMPPGWQSTENSLTAPFSALSMAQSGGAGLAGGLFSTRSPAGPLIGIIESRTAQDDLVERFHLQRVYRVRTRDRARQILSRRTSATEDKPTGILSIVVADRDPVRARDLAAAYIDELNRLVVSMDTSAAHRERIFLDQRVEQVQASLHDAEVQLSGFSSRTGAMDGEAQSRVMLDATSRLQGQLIAAESDLHGLEAIYSSQNVRVEEARARVDTLSGELRKLGGLPGGTGADPDQLYPSLRQLPLLGVTYADLYRRTRTLEVALDLLTRELEAAKIQEAEEIPSVRVLDPPAVAERSYFPPRLLFIVLGSCLGLFIGAAWILGCEVWRRIGDDDPWKRVALEIAASWPWKGRL